jgi:16S rRNA A1518/A1519 N6-dimethyltransferase RsmA/KsgA/DIM1 with predicted DNA glycosylase/AP lyase activity
MGRYMIYALRNKFMNEKEYKKISKYWEGKIYQDLSKNKTKKKTEVCTRCIPFLKGKDVIDIGCNAGLITYDIGKIANRYIAIEYDEHYYRQALETKKHIEGRGKFLLCSVEEFFKKYEQQEVYNAAYAACVLYHLNKKEIDKIFDIMVPKCDIVLFVSSEKKKHKMNNPYNLSRYVNIKSMLRERCGDVQVYHQKEDWVSVVGRN